MVELAAGQVLTPKEYEDLYNHAKNSGIWYAMNLPKTTHEFRKKLYEKGYPEDPVFIQREAGREEVNLVDRVIEWLVDSYYIEDDFIALRYAEKRKRQKYGRSRVAMEMRHKGLDEELVERVLDEVFEEDDEFFSYIEKLYSTESKRSTDNWKVKQKVVQKAAARGHDVGQIFKAIDEIENGLNDDE